MSRFPAVLVLTRLGVRSIAEAFAGGGRRSPDPLYQLVDAALDKAVFFTTADGLIGFWSKGAETILQWSAAEMVGEHLSKLYPDAAAAELDMRRARNWSDPPESAIRIRKDGSAMPAASRLVALHGPTGGVSGFAGVIEDQTARKEIERRIYETVRHLNIIIETMPDAMMIVDDTDRIVSFNAAARRLFRLELHDIIGADVSQLLPLVTDVLADQRRRDSFSQFLDSNIGQTQAIQMRRRDGELFRVGITVSESKIAGRRVRAGYMVDLSAESAAQKQVEKLQAELMQATQSHAMATMAATLAHELNQPLTTIATYLETCCALVDRVPAQFATDFRQAISMAASEAIRAGDIVRHLRSFVASGTVMTRVENLSVLVDGACRIALGDVQGDDDARAVIRIAPDANWVIGDGVQIQQVIINLVKNAREATQRSLLRVIVISSTRAAGDTIAISVEDSGCGLPDAIRSELFAAGRSTKPGNLGIGLLICRTIVEAHGGHIWAEDCPAGGCRISFTLSAVREGVADE